MLKRLFRQFHVVVLSIFAIVISLTVVFVFKNFTRTLEQAEFVLTLRQQVAPDVINSKVWAKVITRLEMKGSTTTLTVMDPFE